MLKGCCIGCGEVRYIKTLRSREDGSAVAYMLYYMSPNSYEFWLSDREDPVLIGDVPRHETLGIGPSWVESCMVVVTHNAKTAALYRYIKNAVTKQAIYPIDRSWDSCILENDRVAFVRVDTSSNSGVIAIDTGESFIEVSAPFGSVCIRASNRRGTPEVFTLYDLLATLCKETGMNLLRYRKIILHSDSRNYTTEIEFTDTLECSRFLSKMSLDISCGESFGFKRSDGLLVL